MDDFSEIVAAGLSWLLSETWCWPEWLWRGAGGLTVLLSDGRRAGLRDGSTAWPSGLLPR